MHYLLETARALYPHVRAAAAAAPDADSPSAIVLRELRVACETKLVHQEARRRSEATARAARRMRVRQEDVTSVPAQTEWHHAGEERAVEILADVLAEAPRRIPEALAAANLTTFYPSFLAYLLATTIESAQPRYRPHGAADWIWWHIWTWFAAREYVALLRDRHEKVARELTNTNSWKTLHRSDQSSDRSDGSGQGRATSASMMGTGDVNARAQQMATRASAAVKQLVTAGRGRHKHEWQRVVQVLQADGDRKQRFVALLRTELLTRPGVVRRLIEVTGAAVPFASAFERELAEIRAARRHRRLDTGPHVAKRYPLSAAADLKLVGLAFSGGGIRSATFNLGVLQGLAQARLLHQVDYLSTVSGGGYLGGWLSTWIKRTGDGPGDPGVAAVEQRLKIEPLPNPDHEDVRTVRFLREYSNYLAPKTGFFSADTWTMFAIWLRNTLLNQSVLVLTLAALLALPWVAWSGLVLVEPPPGPPPRDLLEACRQVTLLSTVLLLAASAVAGQQLRRFHLPPEKRRLFAAEMLGQAGVLLSIVLPALAAAWLLSSGVFHALPHFADAAFRARTLAILALIFSACMLVVAVRGQYWLCFEADRVSSQHTRTTRLMSRAWAVAIILLACGLASLAGSASIVFVASLLAPHADTAPALSQHWIVLGVPAIVAALSLMIVLNLGILGRNLFDEHREWWSRVGAWLTIVALGWLLLFGFGIYSPSLVGLGLDRVEKFVLMSGGIGWAAWTAAGVLLGKGDASHARSVLSGASARRWIVTLAPYVFIAGLLVLVATGTYWLVARVSPTSMDEAAAMGVHWSGMGRLWHWLMAGPLLLIAAAFLLSCRVDINEFSMHHFYKNRLVRCYLGASRVADRCADPFTGFDSADDVNIADLRLAPCGHDEELRDAKRKQNAEKLRPYIGPLPIVNVALNLVAGDDLAWQERKAQAFAFTPFHAGYDHRGGHDGPAGRFAPYGYRPTLLYGYPPFGVGLGTAIAISGAAASPNMGYHSSPATGFLMTMFNARLGWWMGNPRDKYNWLRSGPRRGLLYLINELLGLTNDRTQFVNLSDGGHFENLGIYELIRRRCRFIIASDAERDQRLTFNGLGNAIRKCRTDLGTEISIRATRIQPPDGAPRSALHCVVGDITYPDGEVGTLLYLKASVTGDEPADVLEYQAREPAFPHHSTMSDQFFDESQFESYRKLGFHVAQVAFAVPDADQSHLSERFDDLRDYWYPASATIERHFGAHAEQYGALLERLRLAPGLDTFDPAFFDPAGGNRAERQELFVAASMLDLMQRVFIDLDLEHDADHPHNAGWMAIFRHWMRNPSIARTWEASRINYGRRFQRFVEALRKGS
jgi:hypothetical protein